MGISRKALYSVVMENEESQLQGKENEGTEHSPVYSVHNGGKGGNGKYCVFDKLLCPLRVKMPQSFKQIY